MSWKNKFIRNNSLKELRNQFVGDSKMVWIDAPISRDVPLREDGVNEPNVPSRNGRDTLCETTTVSANQLKVQSEK
jgi:hypothetical protein